MSVTLILLAPLAYILLFEPELITNHLWHFITGESVDQED